jgi:hypothetical protein
MCEYKPEKIELDDIIEIFDNMKTLAFNQANLKIGLLLKESPIDKESASLEKQINTMHDCGKLKIAHLIQRWRDEDKVGRVKFTLLLECFKEMEKLREYVELFVEEEAENA